MSPYNSLFYPDIEVFNLRQNTDIGIQLYGNLRQNVRSYISMSMSA